MHFPPRKHEAHNDDIAKEKEKRKREKETEREREGEREKSSQIVF